MSADSVGAKLRDSRRTVAVAESCTGGKLGDALTDIPGSSDYFLGGVISYSNNAKIDILGVDKSVILEEGAVSKNVAKMMAEGVRTVFGADIGIGITGIAGPTGATPSKPVGLVYIAVCSSERNECAKEVFEGSRTSVKNQAVARTLQLLDEFLDG
ncbi:MAG: CinA family protein [Thermoplasmata archaeon]|nr:CinA family protein [Thermoplasmata archaeon]